MIELKVNKGEVQSTGNGKVLDLLSELALGVGHTLHKILLTAPDERIKEVTIKAFFENVLQTMKKEAE